LTAPLAEPAPARRRGRPGSRNRKGIAVSGKNKSSNQEKEEKKNKGSQPSGEKPESKGKGGSQPDGAAEKKEPAPEEKIQAQLEEKTRQAAEYFDKWIRLQAELENYKKRIQKEKSDQMKFGNESLLRNLLPVLDNLERALDHGKNAREAQPLLAGVEITLKQFLNTLEQFGVRPILAVGEVFDPEKHEALSQVESDFESNRVVSEVQKGYLFHERLLRPAKVIVSISRAAVEDEIKAKA
jgi:molecular chaperone GrpE